MRLLSKIILCSTLLLAVGCPSPQPSPTPPPSNSIVALTNAARIQAGLPPLTENPLLTRAAQNYSQVMASNQQMGHEVAGQTLTMRMDKVGYQWSTVGENVAAGYPTNQSAFTGWMNSPPHKQNIMNPNYTEIGIGVSQSNQFYYCQIFGRPK